MAGFRLRSSVGWCFAGLAVLLLAASVILFAWRPDRFAAFTTAPFWSWALAGVFFAALAARLLKHRRCWWIAAIWCVAALVFGEEWRPHWWLRTPPTESNKPATAVRVLTLNCAYYRFGDPAPSIAAWQPDVILLQEVAPAHMMRIAQAAFGKTHFTSYQLNNAIISRWPLRSDGLLAGDPWRSQRVTLQHPSGQSFQVINVHLSSAATDLRLWQRGAWRAHRITREVHRIELANILKSYTLNNPRLPCLIGGDFNAESGDPIHRLLKADFTDTFSSVGSGWPNTFQRRMPVLRIDYLYHNRAISGHACRAVTTPFTDHRMVVADFMLTPSSKP